jgi:malonyl CoA-acyl carrier protein transacylase
MEIDEAEVLGDEDTSPESLKNMITAAPTLPKSAKNIIMDANAMSLAEKDKKNEELTQAIESVFTKYNEEYGLELSVDTRNLSQALVDVGDPKKRQILELYLSEISLNPFFIESSKVSSSFFFSLFLFKI